MKTQDRAKVIMSIIFVILFSIDNNMVKAEATKEYPDLRVEIIEESIKIKNNRIQFDIEFTNNGKVIVNNVNISVKPFLFSVDEEVDGITLPNMEYQIYLHPNNKIIQQYQKPLPSIPKANYVLGVLVDTKANLLEGKEGEGNNISPLVSIGSLSVKTNSRASGPDIYSEIEEEELTPLYGTIAATLRTITTKKPPYYGHEFHFHEHEIEGVNGIHSRFLLADVKNRRAYLLYLEGYASPELSFGYEKDFMMVWDEEKDKRGRPIYVDYYYIYPYIKDIPPGNYRFLTLTDSRDYAKEKDESNNLDSVPLTVLPLNFLKYPDGLFVAVCDSFDGDSKCNLDNNDEKLWEISNITDKAVSYSVALEYEEQRGWLSVAPEGGILGPNQSVNISLTASAYSLSEGTYTAWIKFSVEGYEGMLVVPVSFFVHKKSNMPICNLRPAQLNTTLKGYWRGGKFHIFHPDSPMVFTISNPGSKELEWKGVQDAKWITLSDIKGKIFSGGSSLITIYIHPESIKEIGEYKGNITIFSSVSGDRPVVKVTVLIDEIIIPRVIDEGYYTRDSKILKADWFYSEREGIAEYKYRITEGVVSPRRIIKDWTSVGTETAVTVEGLSLENSKKYYFEVKAQNNAGVWSGIGYSDGITVDSLGPSVMDKTSSPQKAKQSLLFQAEVIDNVSGVQNVYLVLLEKKKEKYYSMKYNLQTSSYVSNSLKVEKPENIHYRIVAEDKIGNKTVSDIFILEVTE